jgi:hypothetical protein
MIAAPVLALSVHKVVSCEAPALHDHLNLREILAVVTQRQHRDLRFPRLAVAQDPEPTGEDALGQRT